MSDSVESSKEGPVLDLSRSKRSLDIPRPNDIARAIRDGWQIDPERKRQYFEAMDKALTELPEDPRDRAHIIVGVNRVLQAEQAAALRDVHHLESIDQENGIMRLKQERAEAGLPNDSVALILPPVRQMPMPDWMENLKEGGKN